MKIIEVPVEKIERGTLEDCVTYITPLMNSLYSVYENSNFYKEEWITSFMDQLLHKCLEQITEKFPFSRMAKCYWEMPKWEKD